MSKVTKATKAKVMPDKSTHGWVTDGVNRPGRNEGNAGGTDRPDKQANQVRQTGKQLRGHHSGVKHPANRANGGILNNE
jgi:hypothetical protein